MTPLHSQILTARDRNGQELRTIQNQLQKLPPGKLICSRNGTTVKWYQGDGHSKTYIPKANRSRRTAGAEKVSAATGTNTLAGAGSDHCLFKILPPAGSLSSDDPHLLSDPACEKSASFLFFHLKKYSGHLECFQISRIFRLVPLSNGLPLPYERNPLHPEQGASQNRLRREGAFQIGSHDCHAAPPKRHSLPLRM